MRSSRPRKAARFLRPCEGTRPTVVCVEKWRNAIKDTFYHYRAASVLVDQCVCKNSDGNVVYLYCV